jgi:Mg-chelatase subunit ChlD
MNMKVLILILLSLISLATCQTCDQSVLDMFIVIDSSGSIGAADFALAKSSVVDMINKLNIIGPQKIRVGVINYSSTVSIVTSFLDTDQDKTRIIAQVNNMPFLGGSTATGDALQRARQIFFNYPRDVTPRVLVLFTDGQSNTGANVYTEADLLKKQKVEIFTVGIGSGVSHVELDQVSSLPITTYKKMIKNYQELYAAINDITKTACKAAAYVDVKTTVQVKAVPKNEPRYFQVDMTKISKAAGDLIMIELDTKEGICVLDSVSWLTSTKAQPIESSNFSNRAPQEGKTIIHFYEVVPPKALRLYVTVKCIGTTNSYQFVIDKF